MSNNSSFHIEHAEPHSSRLEINYVAIGDWIIIRNLRLEKEAEIFHTDRDEKFSDTVVYEAEVLSGNDQISSGETILWGMVLSPFVWVDKRLGVLAISKYSVIAVKEKV